MRTLAALVVLALPLAACSSPPDAMSVCKKLQAAGAASSCQADAPSGLSAGARERVLFDVPGLAPGTGEVLSFEKAEAYETTTKAFTAAAALAGRHQYGNAKALIFVHLNAATAQPVADKAKATIDGL